MHMDARGSCVCVAGMGAGRLLSIVKAVRVRVPLLLSLSSLMFFPADKSGFSCIQLGSDIPVRVSQ